MLPQKYALLAPPSQVPINAPLLTASSLILHYETACWHHCPFAFAAQKNIERKIISLATIWGFWLGGITTVTRPCLCFVVSTVICTVWYHDDTSCCHHHCCNHLMAKNEQKVAWWTWVVGDCDKLFPQLSTRLPFGCLLFCSQTIVHNCKLVIHEEENLRLSIIWGLWGEGSITRWLDDVHVLPWQFCYIKSNLCCLVSWQLLLLPSSSLSWPFNGKYQQKCIFMGMGCWWLCQAWLLILLHCNSNVKWYIIIMNWLHMKEKMAG